MKAFTISNSTTRVKWIDSHLEKGDRMLLFKKLKKRCVSLKYCSLCCILSGHTKNGKWSELVLNEAEKLIRKRLSDIQNSNAKKVEMFDDIEKILQVKIRFAENKLFVAQNELMKLQSEYHNYITSRLKFLKSDSLK